MGENTHPTPRARRGGAHSRRVSAVRQRSAHSNTHQGAIAQRGVRLTARSSAVARPKGESEWTAQCAWARASMLTLKICRPSARTRLARFAPSLPARRTPTFVLPLPFRAGVRPRSSHHCVAGAAPGVQALRGSGGPTWGGRASAIRSEDRSNGWQALRGGATVFEVKP